MRIDPKSEICGIPALKVRDALRQLARVITFDENDLATRLNVPAEVSTCVLRYLESKRYIEDRPTDSEGPCYALTTPGRQFTQASGAPALPRAKAETMLSNFLQRVKALNADDGYTSRVKEVFVFGGFLTAATELSDLDVAVRLERRYHGEEYTRRAKERAELAEAGGRHFRNIVDELGWPEIEVKRFLINKTRGISLHEADELERLGCAFKEVFPENRLTDERG